MNKSNSFLSALFLGVLSSFFFAFNFVLIRSMSLSGGYFLWPAVLRYWFTLPLMAILLIQGNGFRAVFESIKRKPAKWFLWSTVGFGLFYAPLSMAAMFGESWFTAALWQFTIVAGVLLTPLFGKKIPKKNLLCGFVIIAGIFMLQFSKMQEGVEANWWMLLLTMGVATFSYPLGNRKMMSVIEGEGLPTEAQLLQSFLIALVSGVIATILFFEATRRVQHDAKKLAVIEATQSGEVIFTLILGVLLLGDASPTGIGLAGVVVIVAGMVLNSRA